MKPRHNSRTRKEPKPVKVKRAPGTPTKSQLRAAEVAAVRATRERWKTVIAEAQTQWSKLHQQELAKVDGNFHVLAGLVQMRYQLGRADADRQVKAFFDKHIPPVAPVAASVTLQLVALPAAIPAAAPAGALVA